jgi:mitogen-activated protein kinase organizer 1
VKLWDLRATKNSHPVQVLSDFKDSVTKVAITAECKIIASSVDGFLRIFDMRMGKLLSIGLPKDTKGINSFDISKLDPNYILTSCLDSTVRLLDASDAQIVSSYSGGHKQENYHGSVRFSKDNKLLYCTSESNSVSAYSVSDKTQVGQLTGHSMPVIALDVYHGHSSE